MNNHQVDPEAQIYAMLEAIEIAAACGDCEDSHPEGTLATLVLTARAAAPGLHWGLPEQGRQSYKSRIWVGSLQNPRQGIEPEHEVQYPKHDRFMQPEASGRQIALKSVSFRLTPSSILPIPAKPNQPSGRRKPIPWRLCRLFCAIFDTNVQSYNQTLSES
jgi:hypothetical protein